MGAAQPTERLTESYARWRSSRLGQITDALEQQVLFELVGPVSSQCLLDVGCGDGAMASEFARRGAVVTGLDADPEMMAAAQRRIETESIQMLLIKGRAEKLPFNDGTFDRVLAVTVLYAFAKARERPVLCFAQVTNQMGRIEGDFEKGAADGAQESLRVISLAVSRWPAEKLS